MSSALESVGRDPRSGTLRARLTIVLAVALGGLATIATGALAAVEARALERQLDASLHAHAASEVLTAIDRPDRIAHLHDAPLPMADSPDALQKYAALYDVHGNVVAHTSTFQNGAPAYGSLPTSASAFDLTVGRERLRAVRAPMGGETAARTLLLAVPRSGLDAALRSLGFVSAALLAAALLVATALAAALARWLTKDLGTIATAARAVAAGALDARVGPVSGAREVQALARDLDEMIARLEVLVATQRRFVSDAAHELRSPLTSLRGELELSLRRPRTADEYRETLARSHQDVLELCALTDDLLALARARTRSGGTESAPVMSALTRCAELVKARAEERGVVVKVDVEADLRAAIGPRDLERIVRNLAENAVHHAPAGSTVELSARPDEACVTIAVLDAGPGVPVEQAERIFEPFVRLDPARTREGGAGLGLAIAREVARAHGGDVTLDVEHEGTGARFVAWLPKAH